MCPAVLSVTKATRISPGRRSYTGQRAAVVSVIFLVNPEQSQNLQSTLGSVIMSGDSLSRCYLPG